MGKEGTHSPYLLCPPCAFQGLVKASCGVLAPGVTEDPVSNQRHVRGG